MSDGITWLRLYHSFLDNSKTGSLSMPDRGYWVTLAILASRNSPRGLIPPMSILKRYMGESNYSHPARITAILERFYRLTLLDKRDGQYYLHNFGSRQWLPEGEKEEKNTPFRQSSDKSPTLCRDKMSESVIENKGVMVESYTENPATDTDTELLGGFIGNVFIEFNALLARIRQSACNPQALADSRQALPGSAGGDSLGTEGGTEGVGAIAPPVKQRTAPQKPVVCELFPVCDTPKRSVIAGRVSASGEAFQETWDLWQALPGIAHHRRPCDTDRQAFRVSYSLLGGDSQALADIKLAITRYSTWSTGAKAGKYRPAYRWTFAEFVRHKRGSLIQRLASDTWEQTCEPFTKPGDKRPDRSVASLLASASRITGITGEGR